MRSPKPGNRAKIARYPAPTFAACIKDDEACHKTPIRRFLCVLVSLRLGDKRVTLVLGTLVYCLDDVHTLLMHRNKDPNRGLWVAPGGKVEAHESPYECARRELREETGLQAQNLLFRGLITEVSPRPDYHWMLFIYVVTHWEGKFEPDEREGQLRWWSLDEVQRLPIPPADAVFYPHVTDLRRPFYQAKFVYDADLGLIEVCEYGRQ